MDGADNQRTWLTSFGIMRNHWTLFDGPLVAIPQLGIYHVSGEEI